MGGDFVAHDEQAVVVVCFTVDSCPGVDDVVYSRTLPHVEVGIPEAAFDLDCPDIDLKASVLQEFILIDSKYQEKYNEILENHQLKER